MKDPCSQMLTSVRVFFVADLNLFTAFHLLFFFFVPFFFPQENILNGMVINANFFKITLCFWDVIFQVGNKQEIGN